MAESSIQDKVKAIIAEEVSIDPATIKPESTLEDLKIESIDLVQIMFKIEEEFDIYLADEELGVGVKNVGEVFAAVEKLVAKKQVG